MNRQLTPKDVAKVLAALCVVMVVTGGALFTLRQRQEQSYRQEVIRVQSLEMGRIPDAGANSLPEEEGQMADPNFKP